MNLTLEMIDEVIARTECTYKEAKEALNEADGDTIEAIIIIEAKCSKKEKVSETFDNLTNEFTEMIKKLLEKGDVNRISIEKNDKIILNIPVTAGVVGTVFFAPAVITSLIVALGTGHSVKMIKENGEIIDLKKYTDKTMNVVKEKASTVKEKMHKTVKEEVVETDEEEVTEEKETVE